MTIRGQEAHTPLLRWDIWWRWALASLIGIIVANILYRALPQALLYPLDDEDIWLIQPWRVAALTCVYYTPISLAQWFVLRRYTPRAGWWLIVTLGSVVVAYPGSIWILYTLGQWDAAWLIWFLGMGGITVYVMAQWVALLRWMRSPRIWGLWFVAILGGWFLVQSVIVVFSSDLTTSVSQGGVIDLLLATAFSSLYQLTMGVAPATILQPDSQSEMTQTTISA